MKSKGGKSQRKTKMKVSNIAKINLFNEPEHDMLTEKGLADGRILKTIVLNSFIR
jgi:hypothetical protein